MADSVRIVRLTPSLTIPYPIMAVAPMVGQCDLPFRELCRRFGANLVYSEMLTSTTFAECERYRLDALGRRVVDSGPLLVQFCGRDPAAFARAARLAMDLGAAGVDLNLGCPQLRAKEGGYGAYLADEAELCEAMVRAARAAVDDHFAVTVKIRLRPTTAETVSFARGLVAAGACMVTLHARPRGRTDARRDGAADLAAVRTLKKALGDVPVLSNGNVSRASDLDDNLALTGADGLAVAEALLANPALFSRREYPKTELVRAYLDACVEFEDRIARDDRSTWQKHGALARAPSKPTDHRRYSNWWSNCECFRQHVRRILDDHDLLQRSTFRKATSVSQLDTFIRKRLRFPDPSCAKREDDHHVPVDEDPLCGFLFLEEEG